MQDLLSPTPVVSAIWLLCIFTAAALPRSGQGLHYGALLAGFAVAGAFAFGLAPASGGIGLLAGAVALWQLLSPSSGRWPDALAGVLGGLGVFLHALLGAPVAAAAVPALLLTLLARHLVQADPRFAPADMRTQALLGASLVSPVLAAWPALIEGWHSARALNQPLQEAQDPSMPGWVWPVVGLAMVAGIVRGLMVRR